MNKPILVVLFVSLLLIAGCTQQPPNNVNPGSKIDVSVDDDAVDGSADAKVTIVEFSDFQCPYCGDFYSKTLPLIRKDYVETGKIKMVYRDFPLTSIHPYAQKAAEASECAHEQGKFWEYHDTLFEKQTLELASLKQHAVDLGLDADKFNTCLDSGKMTTEVQKDLADGSLYGVRGTPAFFINGILVSGAQPYSTFKQIIDQELSKSS